MPKKKKEPLLTLGPDASKEQIRRFLNKVNLRQCVDEDGNFYSPVTGQTFDSYYALMGHMGALLANRSRKPITQDRSGYIASIRRGLPTTDEQRRAHRDYMREQRQRKRDQDLDLDV